MSAREVNAMNGRISMGLAAAVLTLAGCTTRDAGDAIDAGAGIDAAAPQLDGSVLDASSVDAGGDDAAQPSDASTDAETDGGWIPGHRPATVDDILAVTCVPEAAATCTAEHCGCSDGELGPACIEERLRECSESRDPVVSGIHVREDALARCQEARADAIKASCSSDVLPSECRDVFASVARDGASCGRLSGAAGFPVSCADGAGRCVSSFGSGFSCRLVVARGERCVGPKGEQLPCALGDACVDGTCVASDGSCRRASDCAEGGACVDGRCGRGDGELGATCASRADCLVGLGCEGGVCATQSCDGFSCTGESCCPSGSECIATARTTCRPTLREGDSCATAVDPPCGRGLVCALDSDFNSVCRRPRPEGEPCFDSAECATRLCVDNACITPGGRGERCHDDVECEGLLRCIRARCGEGAALGAPCESSEDCARDLRCGLGPDGEGTCRALPHAGEQCVDFECAPGLTCDVDDVCVPLDLACFGSADCQPGSACVGGECQPCTPGCGPDEFCAQTHECTPALCPRSDWPFP